MMNKGKSIAFIVCCLMCAAGAVFPARMERFYERGSFYVRSEGQVSICASGLYSSVPNNWQQEKYRIKIYPQGGVPVEVYTEDFFNIRRLRCPSAVDYEYDSKQGMFVNRYDYEGSSKDGRMVGIIVTVIKWRDFVSEDMVKDLQLIEKDFEQYVQYNWAKPDLTMWDPCLAGMRAYIQVVSLFNLEQRRLKLLNSFPNPTSDDLAEMAAREKDIENLRAWQNQNMGVYGQMVQAYNWMVVKRGIEPEPEPDDGGDEEPKFTFTQLLAIGGIPAAAMATYQFGYTALTGDIRIRDHDTGYPISDGAVMKDGMVREKDSAPRSYGGSGGMRY